MIDVDTVGEDIGRTVAIWHYLLGACLADPTFRQKATKKLANTAAPQEVMGLCYALEKADGKGIWSEMGQYGVKQAKDETVCEALLAKLTTAGKKGRAKALSQKIGILTSGGEYENALVLSKELNQIMEELTKG